ncbi:MAG: tetratricopeptide repeat protein [Smithella sp.]
MPHQQPMTLSIEKVLQQAIAQQKAGQLKDAERLYRAVLEVQPRNPDANHNLGGLAVDAGKPDAALPFLKTAVEVNPRQEQYWLSYIEALLAAGKVQDAQSVLQQGMCQ